MSTECRSLPVRDYLDMGVAMSALQYTRTPRPAYRVLFRLRMQNAGRGSVRLLGRKWTLRDRSGNTRIIEAEQLFNQQPVLTPGSVFSFSGCHSFDTTPTGIEVRFFGTDQRNEAFITPALKLSVNGK
ncbi:MAG: ApaG domain [Akkermansia sp.]|nr:ApaG domain [Akkermansia sp.]